MSQSIISADLPSTDNAQAEKERASVIAVANRFECQAFTVCYALKQSGLNADLWSLEGAADHPSGDHYRKHILANARRELSDSDITPDRRYQHAVALVGYRPPSPEVLHKIARLSSSLTLLIPTFDDHPLRRIKMSLGHLLRFRQLYKTRPRLLAYGDPRRFDCLSLLFRRDVPGVDVHHRFLVDEVMRSGMYALDWNPDVPRPARLNFLGNELPLERTRILQDAEAVLSRMGISYGPRVESKCPWFRIDASSAQLGGQAYLDILTRSDFTLCPPGYSPWTHRVIEAMTRGSIPILSDRTFPVYGVPLESGKNCIAVENDRWAEAIEDALSLSQFELARMRHRLRAMLSDDDRPLSHATITENIAHKVLEGSPVEPMPIDSK